MRRTRYAMSHTNSGYIGSLLIMVGILQTGIIMARVRHSIALNAIVGLYKNLCGLITV